MTNNDSLLFQTIWVILENVLFVKPFLPFAAFAAFAHLQQTRAGKIVVCAIPAKLMGWVCGGFTAEALCLGPLGNALEISGWLTAAMHVGHASIREAHEKALLTLRGFPGSFLFRGLAVTIAIETIFSEL